MVHFKNGTFVERNNNIEFEIRFKNAANIRVFNNNSTTQLAFPTAFTDATPLPKGKYNYNNYGINYSSDTRKNFAYSASVLNGTYFSGKYKQLRMGIIYRKQPYLAFELNAEYNHLKFATLYGSTELFLIAPRVEVNFSNSLFWTTFLQYNTQSNNFNPH